MKKTSLKIIILLIVVATTIVMIKVYPVVETGYKMYKIAVNSVSIDNKIKEIKSDENYIKLDEIPKDYINTVIESEDKRFYYHFGIDLIATSRAMCNNIFAGKFLQGGSTITQQLAKNMYFSFEKKFERKIAELFVAIDLEKQLTKDEIIELYCNITYFGEGCYGLKEGAKHYYGVTPKELTIKQTDALVFTLKCPNVYNPNVYDKKVV